MTKSIDLKPGERILVSRTDRIGDLTLAIPVMESLKARYPECHVDAIASDYAAPVLENNPSIDNVISVNNNLLYEDEGLPGKIGWKIAGK